ncbi:predicted protein [Uncinocarpus reesii 1704]|uniref:F-box domain-containing protein n=1 Tax=Uncinocarpus reesii (strain UAMH 1704) TaxID=336963 RepID=C4JKH8_UNCRE|nr:uncharacterized protein UREG_02135 [Uncinocarpus reesii 1704]EEP77286.1 predicted protein [Uncinocarpus reesii 1704]
MPNLEELYLEGSFPPRPIRPVSIANHRNLKSFTYASAFLNSFPDLPRTLEHLRFESSIIIATPQGNPLSRFTRLRSATFAEFMFLRAEMLEGLLSNTKGILTRFTVRWCSEIEQNHLEPLMRKGLFKSITHLDIAGTVGVTDAITPTIIKTMPNLKVLDISRTKVTGLTIKQFADAQIPKLEKIIVHPVSIDAVEYAIRLGIQIVRSYTPPAAETRNQY